MTWLRNAWYVAAWDGEVRQAPLARTLLGVPVMLYRKLDGTPVAMHDACPHHLLPLSLEIKEGDSIRCRYHGLKLGPDGCAEEMPLRTNRVNPGVKAQAYPVVERYRFVWIWLGDEDRADPSLIPELWPCSAPGWTFDGGYVPVACDYRLMIDNLMDLTHETYVHSDSIGQIELMEAPIETRWQICEFVPPSCVMIDAGVAPFGAGATIANHDQGVRGFVIDGPTPESETRMHYFWGMARNFLVDDPGFTVRFKTQQGGVFAQDVEILEAQQRSIAANPGLRPQALNIDQGGVRARRMIALENAR